MILCTPSYKIHRLYTGVKTSAGGNTSPGSF